MSLALVCVYWSLCGAAQINVRVCFFEIWENFL